MDICEIFINGIPLIRTEKCDTLQEDVADQHDDYAGREGSGPLPSEMYW